MKNKSVANKKDLIPLIRIQDLSLRYKYKSNFAFQHFNLDVFEGDIIIVSGPNGSGKSTILKAIGRVFPKDSIEEINGSITYSKALGISLVFQRPKSQILTFRVDEELATSLNFSRNPTSRSDRMDLVNRFIHEYDLKVYQKMDPRFLSAGEQQKLIVLASIIATPRILLLDEPFSLLDDDNKNILIKSLQALNSKGLTIIITDSQTSPLKQIDHRLIEIPFQIERKGIPIDFAEVETSSTPILLNGDVGYEKTLFTADFEFSSHGLHLITGPNGSGKTLILKTLVGITSIKHGEVMVPDLLYLDQDNFNFFYRKSVSEEWDNHYKMPVWIEDISSEHPYTLSEGEQKRLALEICFRADRGLVLDEPSKSLDQEGNNWLIQELRKQLASKLIVIASNDQKFIQGISDSATKIWELPNSTGKQKK